MTSNDAIRAVMKIKGITHSAMARALGFAGPNSIGSKLDNKNMSVSKMIPMLDVCGYELVIQPKTQGQRKEGCIVIEVGKDDE